MTEQLKTERRGFLKILGFGSVAVAAPIVATNVQAAESNDDKKKARYKETEHVKAFYRTNRY